MNFATNYAFDEKFGIAKVQYLFRMEEIYLNFNETMIQGDEGLCMLSEGISEMAQLKKVDLNMDFTKISDFGFNHLTKSLL